MDREAYSYISEHNLDNTLFDISGVIQARKNKNEVPFIYYKVDDVISDEDKEKIGDGRCKEEIVDNTNVKAKKKKKGASIKDIVKHFGLDYIDMSADKIKLTEKKHLKTAIVKME